MVGSVSEGIQRDECGVRDDVRTETINKERIT